MEILEVQALLFQKEQRGQVPEQGGGDLQKRMQAVLRQRLVEEGPDEGLRQLSHGRIQEEAGKEIPG